MNRSLGFVAPVVFIIFFRSDPVFSQTNGETEKIGKYKWDVNFNLLPFLRDVRTGQFEVLTRRQYAATGTAARALRLGFDMVAVANDDRVLSTRQPGFPVFPTSVGNIREERRFEMGLTPGHEWRRQADKFTFIYGVDMPLRYASGYFINEVIPQSGPDNQIESRGTSYSIGVSGFVGMRYVFGRHFSVGAETHLTYLFTHTRGMYTVLAPAGPTAFETRGTYSPYEGSRHTITFNPLQAIYLGYQF